MDFVYKMMDFVSNFMNFVFKMMMFYKNGQGYALLAQIVEVISGAWILQQKRRFSTKNHHFQGQFSILSAVSMEMFFARTLSDRNHHI